MQRGNNLLGKIWGLFNKGNASPTDMGLVGNQFGIGYANRRNVKMPVNSFPVRAYNGDMSISTDLIEIKTWSYEFRHAISFLSRDCFQRMDGATASWDIAETIKIGSEEVKVNPEVIAIGRDIANRMNGTNYVLGGDRLKRAAVDALWAGDAFLELAFDKEGIGRNDWGISTSQFLPPFTMFIEQTENGYLNGYTQRTRSFESEDDRFFTPLKILNFQYDCQDLYGTPLSLQSIDAWDRLKKAAIDLEDAARSVGIAPWLHIMPEAKDERYKNLYKAEHHRLKETGIVTDLYLLNGADVRKANSNNDVLGSLMEYLLNQRFQMVPAGVPVWMYPGLGLERSVGREMANQPSLAYGRMIADLRSMLGTQIKKAINIEIIMKKGYDWWVANGRLYDIVWAEWFVTGLEQGILTQGVNTDQNQNDPNKEADQTVEESKLLLTEPDTTDLPAINLMAAKIQRLMTENPQLTGKLWDTGIELELTKKRLSNGHALTN